MTERLSEDYFDDMQKITRHYAKSNNIDLNTGGNDFQDIIDKLAEYEIAEKDERLVVLPCKVGSKVFMIFKYINCGEWYLSTKEHIVTDILMNWHRSPLLRITNLYGTVKIEDFGKTVFLTREEAEKALRDLKEQ